ncbi:MAG: NAD-dependent epimerase/dehydratase family protein [Chloroflexi bacterium]|nr:NAD-dependent epimerase/dehydratase family protein [Chloroflexota bacterium]
MSDTCFVTGAGGFLGAALCRRLLAEGYSVRGLDLRFGDDHPLPSVRPEPVEGRDRPPSSSVRPELVEGRDRPASAEPAEACPERSRRARAPDFQPLPGDICDTDLLARGCQGATYVFHLAALLPQRKAPPAEMRRVNVEGARLVLEAARTAAVRRVVLMSSAEVYGVPRVIHCPEDAPLRPIGEYGRNKVEAEHLAAQAMAQGLEVAVLRPPTIVGPGMAERLLRGTLSDLRRNRPLFVPSGPTRFQMVALSDVVAACLLAVTRPEARGETFNLGSDDVPTLLETTRRLRTLVGSRSSIVPVPTSVARLFFRALLTLGRSPLEPEHIQIAFSNYVFDTAKAKRLLGWRPSLDNAQALAEAYRGPQ